MAVIPALKNKSNLTNHSRKINVTIQLHNEAFATVNGIYIIKLEFLSVLQVYPREGFHLNSIH